MNNSVIDALSHFFTRYQKVWQESGYPTQNIDPRWPSDCYNSETLEGEAEWQPIKRQQSAHFDNLSQALELTIHPDISAFYGTYYSDPLPALFDEHSITIIQAWNAEDFERLQQNMIQHLLMQKQLKQPATLFLATTDDEMELISMKNDSGEVIVERLGKGQVALLSTNLAEFIDKLKPVT